jgi:hypothetical protein
VKTALAAGKHWTRFSHSHASPEAAAQAEAAREAARADMPPSLSPYIADEGGMYTFRPPLCLSPLLEGALHVVPFGSGWTALAAWEMYLVYDQTIPTKASDGPWPCLYLSYDPDYQHVEVDFSGMWGQVQPAHFFMMMRDLEVLRTAFPVLASLPLRYLPNSETVYARPPLELVRQYGIFEIEEDTC